MFIASAPDLWLENEANIYGLQKELCCIILSNTKLVFLCVKKVLMEKYWKKVI